MKKKTESKIDKAFHLSLLNAQCTLHKIENGIQSHTLMSQTAVNVEKIYNENASEM